MVKLPVYFLRWLPYVDAEILFLALALRQECYLAAAGKGSATGKVTARAERVCRWAGISRAQFFRLLQPGSGFEWFGKKSETGCELDRRTGRAKKSANQYSLYGIPITPGDADDLRRFLLEQGVQTDPHKALLAALAAQPGQILQYPVRERGTADVQKPSQRQTVQEIVREVAGQKLSPELIDLADRLSDHLLTPNEFILVSWYFLQHWLPLLGPNAAMLVLMLRSACYFNDATGEMRDEVWIEGGYETLARRLGIENPRQIANWFPAAIERGRRKVSRTDATQKELDRRAQFQERMGAFVERIDHRPAGNGSYSWKFKVRRSDPLTPEHERIYQEIVRLIADLDREGLLDELMAQIEPQSNDCSETHENQPRIVLRRSDFLNGCPETLSARINDCLATLERSGNDCFETLLKILKAFKDSFTEKDSLFQQDSQPAGCAERIERAAAELTGSDGHWRLDILLRRAGEKQRLLLERQEQGAIPFVSWLIHGAANPRIQSPYSLAIAKLVETPRAGAGGACDRLAALPPEQLARMIRQQLSFSRPSNQDWGVVFRNTGPDRFRLLADLLSIPLELLEIT